MNNIFNDLLSDDIEKKTEASVELLMNDSIFLNNEIVHSEEEILIYLLKKGVLINKEDVLFIKKCLTYKSNRIYDISSFLIEDCLKKALFIDIFSDEEYVNAYVYMLNGVSPNVCRNTINILKYINNPLFVLEKIIIKIKEGNLKTTYWYFSAIAELIKRNDTVITEKIFEDLIVLFKSYLNNKEYQIREKIAESIKGLVKNDNQFNKKNELNGLINVLKNDSNFYVRNIFTQNDLQGDN